MKPAPADKKTSDMGMVNPVGTPFILGSPLRDSAVFDIHIGKFPNP